MFITSEISRMVNKDIERAMLKQLSSRNSVPQVLKDAERLGLSRKTLAHATKKNISTVSNAYAGKIKMSESDLQIVKGLVDLAKRVHETRATEFIGMFDN